MSCYLPWVEFTNCQQWVRGKSRWWEHNLILKAYMCWLVNIIGSEPNSCRPYRDRAHVHHNYGKIRDICLINNNSRFNHHSIAGKDNVDKLSKSDITRFYVGANFWCLLIVTIRSASLWNPSSLVTRHTSVYSCLRYSWGSRDTARIHLPF